MFYKKRKAKRNAAAKRVLSYSLNTPSTFGQETKNYKQLNGPVVIYNLYDKNSWPENEMKSE
ncbi:MAG: hypothetical protein WC677_08610 [Clostridia bacterium]|jgi:hypothetical protein